jgi:hypothetical protein
MVLEIWADLQKFPVGVSLQSKIKLRQTSNPQTEGGVKEKVVTPSHVHQLAQSSGSQNQVGSLKTPADRRRMIPRPQETADR